MIERGCHPAFAAPPGIGRRRLRAEGIAWRMAGSAMAEPFGEIGTAIPCNALPRIGLEAAWFEIEQAPAGHHNPEIERKLEIRRFYCIPHGRSRHQVGVE